MGRFLVETEPTEAKIHKAEFFNLRSLIFVMLHADTHTPYYAVGHLQTYAGLQSLFSKHRRRHQQEDERNLLTITGHRVNLSLLLNNKAG